MKLIIFVAVLLIEFASIEQALVVVGPRDPSHIVKKESSKIHQGCQIETINLLDNAKWFTTYEKINEGQPCPEDKLGVCHDGWCTKRDSNFGLVSIPKISLHLTQNHSVEVYVCVSNASTPASFPLNVIKMHEICPDYVVLTPDYHGNNLFSIEPKYWTKRVVPDGSLIHFQVNLPPTFHYLPEIIALKGSEPITNEPIKILPRPVTIKTGILGSKLGGGSISTHQLALSYKAKHDESHAYSVELSEKAGKIAIQAAWRGVLPGKDFSLIH